MCGIAGIVTSRGVDRPTIARMTATLAHRGPDDQGIWTDPDAGVALGHRRLAIIDLSPQGRQPMESADGRYVLSFNGEIYNHRGLRRELEERGNAPEAGWRGHSDTETMLQAIAALGLERALEKMVGMFAFAVWDRGDRTLSLVRDRFGEKPLYYGWAGGDFVFASELKALRAHPRFENAVERRAVALFAQRAYVPAPLSIYRGIFKLLPGCILTLNAEGARRPLVDAPEVGSSDSGLKLTRYWSYADVVNRGLQQPIGDEHEALDDLENVLAQAIAGQAVADVPVGAFLSGGVDSSTVVALYQKQSPIAVRTYSIGFEEAGFNEAEDARRVAAHLGTVHHEHYVTVKEARDVIPRLPSIYDEPFADYSQIPTFLVSRFAANDVTVALTGDGGDELFGGYNRHVHAPRLWNALRHVPRPARALLGSAMGRVPASFWASAAGATLGDRHRNLAGKLQKGFRLAASVRDLDDLYRGITDEWSFEPSPVEGGGDAQPQQFDAVAPDAVRLMYADAVGYLPGDVLCKVDRASMAVSLETRVPLLDHRVAELAARMPIDLKIRNGRGKHVLRRLLHQHVPPALVDRPKAGFTVPVGEWIKGPLRGWAEELLDPLRLAQDGWFNPAVVERRWHEHLSGRRDSPLAIWAVLMFQAWRQERPSGSAAEQFSGSDVRNIVAKAQSR